MRTCTVDLSAMAADYSGSGAGAGADARSRPASSKSIAPPCGVQNSLAGAGMFPMLSKTGVAIGVFCIVPGAFWERCPGRLAALLLRGWHCSANLRGVAMGWHCAQSRRDFGEIQCNAPISSF